MVAASDSSRARAARSGEARLAADQLSMHDGKLYGGIALLLIGLGLVAWTKRRRFYRTNAVAIKQFRSFEPKIWARLLQGTSTSMSLVCATTGATALGAAV